MAATTTLPQSLPPGVLPDDTVLLTSILTAINALDIVQSYKVDVLPQSTHYLVRGIIKEDVREIDNEDLNLLLSVSPLRIERVYLSRVPSCSQTGAATMRLELVVKVLSATQRVMASGMATFVALKKRKLVHLI